MLSRLAPFLVLLAEVLLFFRMVLFSHEWLIPWDIRGYHLPIAYFSAESLSRWELPLWDPSVYCGRPLYANLTAQVFYPPTLLALSGYNLTGGGSDTLLYMLEWQLALHVFAGGCFAWLLAREMGLETLPALFTATAFQLGAFFASQTQHLGAIDAAAYLPLAWFCALRYGRERRPRWLLLLGVVFALTFLAGFPAMTFVAFASTLLFTAVVTRSIRAVAGVAASIGGGLALAGIQLLPTLELTRLSVAKFRVDWMGSGGGMPLASLLTLVAPNHAAPGHEPTFLYTFSGFSVLAAAGFATFRRARHAAALLGFTLVCLLWMLGDSTPAGAALFRLLPRFLQSSVYMEFALAAFTLALALLAGSGVNRVKNRRWQVALVAVCAIELIAFSSNRSINTISRHKEPGISERHFDGIPEILETVRKLVHQAKPPYRIDTMNESIDWSYGAPITGVPTANGNDPFALESYMRQRLRFVKGERWGRYYDVENPTSPMLDFLNVRYLLAREPLDPVPAGYGKVAELPGRVVYENRDVWPRFFVADRLDTPEPRTADRVAVIEYSPRRVRLEVEASGGGFLVSSEADYPGWEALLDGQPAKLDRAYDAFRAVAVPAGTHRIEMRFEPRVLRHGAMLTAAAALGLLLLAWRTR